MKPDDTQPTKTCAYVPCGKAHTRAGDFCSDKCFRAQWRAERAKKPGRGQAKKEPKEKRDWKGAITKCCVGNTYISPGQKCNKKDHPDVVIVHLPEMAYKQIG